MISYGQQEIRGTTFWGRSQVSTITLYLAQDLGPFGITANGIAPGVIATGRIMATVIPGSSQSNRDRAELVALRRLGTVEDLRQGRRISGDRPVRLRDGRGDPDRWRAGQGIGAIQRVTSKRVRSMAGPS